ncbi:MAG TPA: folylpolyglutamate synthase/dihydrofolate synthase family protein [Bryobacteraceae bacterium]|nr:folylpolyglutamate synthase/dihydrofolate synthase family protein [Bryobacteraceae bacterium]
MSYPDSVRYLYALGNELKAGATFDLAPMQTLVAALGNPERGQRFVHIAGTNGKGSTCAFLSSIFKQAGLRTGLYTSPHLIEPTERIKIDGEPVTAEEFTTAFYTVHKIAEQLVNDGRLSNHPSYFETVTAMALLIFRERAELTVMEVGLGGRLDATNVITPEISVITPVSYDHEAYLGNALSSIAGEKAGIIKPGVPVVLAPQHPVAEKILTERANKLECPVIQAAMAEVEDIDVRANGSSFLFRGVRYECPLPGRHQIENGVTAILTAMHLGVPSETISEGIKVTRWPGRLERVASQPDFILDGAHNPAGAAALAEYIREVAAGRPVWIVYGAMRDKAIEEVTEQLFPLADRLILTMPDFPRALRPDAILAVTGHPRAVLSGNVDEAIAEARKAPREGLVFFTGSLYLVGEARAKLLAQVSSVS